jgi:heat shock protein HspQ
MASKIAKFNIGDWVRHSRQGYRAVIVDVDPIFQASGYFNPQSLMRDFASRNPWYRLLVDGCSQITYVEECMLLADEFGGVVDNPNVAQYLKQRDGHYFASARRH